MSRFLIIKERKGHRRLYHLHDKVVRTPRHLPASSEPLSRRVRTFFCKKDCERYSEILEKIDKPPAPKGMGILT